MNRYPIWKYLLIVAALLFGIVYTIPNFFGEAPAVQVSSSKATLKIDTALMDRIQSALGSAGIDTSGVIFDGTSVKVRFNDTDAQLKAKDVLNHTLNPDQNDPLYVVALNLLSNSPTWLSRIGANPMALGLDLRGGVHFLLQVDMKQAYDKRIESSVSEIRSLLRDKNVRHAGIVRAGNAIEVRFRDAETMERARGLLVDNQPGFAFEAGGSGTDLKLTGTLRPRFEKETLDAAIKQNMTTLNNRVNELAVAEPIIQQQGPDRIIVQLPGVQDTAKAKDILGRTATLEARLVDQSSEAQSALMGGGAVPFNSELFKVGRGAPVVLRKQAIFTGEQLTGAQATFDQDHRPAVSINLNDAAGRVMREVSRENLRKPMAVVLFERGRGEVLTVATIQSELGSRFQITGMESPQAANDLALLLRAGALAAPMEIIEERTIGPSLGADNIQKGFDSVKWGFVAVALFMIVYYQLFGLVSALALGANLLLLVALLSLLQATLTLPGMAAIALALGLAIDANVLVNERVRDELRNGTTPQASIAAGYERAWGTILDSNVTTLIAGIALLVFGSGPVKGFAVVHCLGILTSMFSAVFLSRGLINLWYGRKKKLTTLSIGQVWKPTA
ncbi:MAG: protein translocase subunit SecD [Burkholderiaceae bacterium]